jgi:hypothetical protein
VVKIEDVPTHALELVSSNEQREEFDHLLTL